MWNELDLVPFRTTVAGGGSNVFVIAVDREDAGHPGYDVLSAPVINDALSDDSCQVSSSAEQIQAPGQGGADKTLYRVVTMTSAAGTTCVIDWYARLALGSHLYPGSSLHANLLSINLDTGGIGSKEVSIPVKEILPQKIEKTMTATQGVDVRLDAGEDGDAGVGELREHLSAVDDAEVGAGDDHAELDPQRPDAGRGHPVDHAGHGDQPGAPGDHGERAGQDV